METKSTPFTLDLQFRGFITGSVISSASSDRELCRYFGGIPYALPPVGPNRFLQPRPLPPCYQYGTRASPGVYTGKCSVCPQQRASELEDEDCLQLNMWIPAGEPPKNGWPVYFYIHGGFLQIGSANDINPVALLSSTPFRAIIVMPSYRLNIYGFLASRELLQEPSNRSKTVGNLGFWDQRMALTWTYTNISYFRGDASNITVAGYSAGAHSAFYQLAYDLDAPPAKRLIKRVCMHANGPGLPPKPLAEHQEQFDELLTVLNIPLSLPAAQKLERLRSLSPGTLRLAIPRMKRHQFRAVTDGVFITPHLFPSISNGVFALKLLASGTKILLGDSQNEHFLYSAWHPPGPSASSLTQRLSLDYPRWSLPLLARHHYPSDALPAGTATWRELFGRVYAGLQIHATQRGLAADLARHGAARLLLRYRIAWRSAAARTPPAYGPTHGSDDVLWWFGNGRPLPPAEERIVSDAFARLYAAFVAGDDVRWGAEEGEVRRLRSDGTVDFVRDERAEEEGVALWRKLMEGYRSFLEKQEGAKL